MILREVTQQRHFDPGEVKDLSLAGRSIEHATRQTAGVVRIGCWM
jgi:hypothetical protein